jgi:hypothetical protein
MKPSSGHFTQRSAPDWVSPAVEDACRFKGSWIPERAAKQKTFEAFSENCSLECGFLGLCESKGSAGFCSFVPMDRVQAAVPGERGNTRSDRASFFLIYEISAKFLCECGSSP